MRKKGLFIVVDGPSTSGKDSIIQKVVADLDKLGIKAFTIEETKDPSYDGKKVLEVKRFGDRKVAETIISERKKLYQTKIIPQLLSNKLVIVNRGEPSTLAYQTINNELTMEKIWNIHRQQQIPHPDLIVITNCSVEEAIRREKLREHSSEEKDKNLMSGKFTSVRRKIHANYKIVKDFLEKKEISIIYLNTDKMNLLEESRMILNFIKNKINYLHE